MTTEIESLATDNAARRTGSGVSPMWFAFAALALLLALYAHWRFGQFDERIDRLRAQVGESRTAQQQLAQQVATLGAKLEQTNDQFRSEIRGLHEVPMQVGELGQTVAELRARTEAPQRAWVRAEALYLLELAARRLRLEHDVPTAIAAMESADVRLATVADPGVAEVRAQLARELEALRSVTLPDLPNVIARLTAVETTVDRFRVLGVPVAQARRSGQGARETLGPFARAMNRVAQAWHDLFSYRRVEPAMSRLVTREEESLRRQHFELLLFGARIAAMQRDRVAYQQALQSSLEWLNRFFDVRDPEVRAARGELAALSAIDVDPARPEVGTAAQQLQRVIRAGSPPAAP